MGRRVTDRTASARSAQKLRALNGGKMTKGPANGRVKREAAPGKRRTFVPAKELAEALSAAPSIDYEQLRADIDAVVDQDPTLRYLA
jgi:hypothetical protein